MEMKFIDTHSHVNINAFKDDFDEVISRAHEAGVAMINIGTQQDTSAKAVEIAERYEDGVYAIVGLHPVHTSASYHDESELGENMKAFTSRGEVFDVDFYRSLASSKKVVGIGECGYDYYRLEKDTKAVQEEAFIAQIELANELGLPLMIHTRDAKGNQASAKSEAGVGNVYDDTYETLKRYAKVPGNIHFYAGNWEQAKRFFDIGFTISFTGVITFAKDYEEVVRNTPLDMIHGETDCPYVAPKPYRGQRCEPFMVQEVYKKIAEIKGVRQSGRLSQEVDSYFGKNSDNLNSSCNEDEEKVRVQLLENARKLYKLA